jgi:hypothetical protein
MSISRRKLLSLAVKFTAAAPLMRVAPILATEQLDPAPASKGRIASWIWVTRESPSFTARITDRTGYDDVISLTGQVSGEAWGAHQNKIWYATPKGFIHSAYVVPVEDIQNAPVSADIAKATFWAEVSVPFVDLRYTPSSVAYIGRRLYYGTVYRVVDAIQNQKGETWYRLRDGVKEGGLVPASAMRRIDPSELTPLSPEVSNKHIDIDLTDNWVVAYENETEVYRTRCASGSRKTDTQYTPIGQWRVLSKSPATHMSGDLDKPEDAYDLPGVAFSTFITWSGVAIHGTHWHNDFGSRRSHGCLNVTNAAAKWFWRWTSPAAPYESAWYLTPRTTEGTRVTVRYA